MEPVFPLLKIQSVRGSLSDLDSASSVPLPRTAIAENMNSGKDVMSRHAGRSSDSLIAKSNE